MTYAWRLFDDCPCLEWLFEHDDDDYDFIEHLPLWLLLFFFGTLFPNSNWNCGKGKTKEKSSLFNTFLAAKLQLLFLPGHRKWVSGGFILAFFVSFRLFFFCSAPDPRPKTHSTVNGWKLRTRTLINSLLSAGRHPLLFGAVFFPFLCHLMGSFLVRGVPPNFVQVQFVQKLRNWSRENCSPSGNGTKNGQIMLSCWTNPSAWRGGLFMCV